MITLKRPLLPFGKNRPAQLMGKQLEVVQIAVVVCTALIGLGLTGLYHFKPDPAIGVFVRVAVLFFAALPGILLEYFLGQNKVASTTENTALQSETIYGTEILQFVFVLILGVFMFEAL